MEQSKRLFTFKIFFRFKKFIIVHDAELDFHSANK